MKWNELLPVNLYYISPLSRPAVDDWWIWKWVWLAGPGEFNERLIHRKDIIVKCDFIFIWKSISSETFHVVVIPKSGKLSWHARGSVTKTITRVKIQSELANWIDFSSQIRFAQPKMFSLNIYVLLWVSWGSPYTKYKSTDPDGIGEGSHESAQREGEADSYRFPSKRLSSRNSTLVEQQRHVDR